MAASSSDSSEAASAAELLINSETCAVEKVVIYDHQSEVTRKICIKETSAADGTLTVRVKGLGASVKPDSVRISGLQTCSIRSTRVEKLDVAVQFTEERMDTLTKLWKAYWEAKDAFDSITAKINTSRETEKSLNVMVSNVMKGFRIAESTDKVQQLKQIRDLLRFSSDRAAKSAQEQAKLKQEKDVLEVEFRARQDDLTKYTMSHFSFGATRDLGHRLMMQSDYAKGLSLLKEAVTATHDVVIGLATDKPMVAEENVYLTYFVTDVWWRVQYDFRVPSAEAKEVHLKMFANISNKSGEDWDNVEVYLCPGEDQVRTCTRPWDVSREIPVLPTDTLDCVDLEGSEGMEGRGRSALMGQASNQIDQVDRRQPEHHSGGTRTMFRISQRVSLKTSNDHHKYEVAKMTLPLEALIYVVPQQSAQAFVMGTVKNTSDLPLQGAPGSLDVYVANAFIRKADLTHDVPPGAEFFVALGEDPTVKVMAHPPITVESKKGFLEKIIRKTTSSSAVIENCRSDPVIVAIAQAYPLSEDSKITVNLVRPVIKRGDPYDEKHDLAALRKMIATRGRAAKLEAHNVSNNHLLQIIELQPNTKEKVELSYFIEYKEGLTVQETDE